MRAARLSAPAGFLMLVVGCGSSATGAGARDASPDSTSALDASGAVPDGGPLSAPEQGVATYYAADGTGNCSFDASPNDLDVAAMDAAEYDNSQACGECVSIVGPKGNVTVRIVDQCPGCEKGHLDLSQQAFAAIADLSAGRVPITWQVVPCTVTGPITYRFKSGSSQYWTAIQVQNYRIPVTRLEIASPASGGAFSDVPRQSYDYFVEASGVGTTGSFQVRVTAVDGTQLVDTLPGVELGSVIQGAAQF
jgi:expansin